MNVEQIVKETINVLASISVPVAFCESIMKPMYGAMQNLQIALDMMQKQAAEPEQEPEELKDVDFGGDKDGSDDKAE